MNVFLRKTVFILSGLLLILIVVTFQHNITGAYAAPSTKQGIVSPKNCRHQFFHLNGTANFTFTCLDKTLVGASPSTSATNCPGGQIELSIPSDGDYACFSGSGFINLANVDLQCTVTHYWTCGTRWYGEAQHYNLYGCAQNLGSSADHNYPGYFDFTSFTGSGTKSYYKNIPNSADFNYPGRGVNVGPYSLLIDC